MDMHTRHHLTLTVLPRYLAANKVEKTKILDEYCANTGYDRKYAIAKLRAYQVTPGVREMVPGRHRRKRERMYGKDVEAALAVLWEAYDHLCAERLHPNLSRYVDKLMDCGELSVSAAVELKLRAVSLGTLKTLITNVRTREYGTVGGTTKPGTLLKNEIPLRVGSWDETTCGFLEIDLVAQCGACAMGEFMHTLNTTDIATGWFEAEAFLGKAQERVFAGLKAIRERLPCTLRGIDSDNGGEFINWELVRYCEREHIEFTRSRSYQKNDNAHIEQKNWTCVRRNLGYTRIEAQERVDAVNTLLRGPLREYINFCLPSQKCVAKKRVGARVVKTYDTARTPYERMLEQTCVSDEVKAALRKRYEEINPVALRREIAMLKRRIFRH